MEQVDFGPTNQEFAASLRRCRQANLATRRKQEAHAAFGILLGNGARNSLRRNFVHFDKLDQTFKERNNVARLRRNIQADHGSLSATAVRFSNLFPLEVIVRNCFGKFLRNRNHAHERSLVLDRVPTRNGSRAAKRILERSLLYKRVFKAMLLQKFGHFHFPNHRGIEISRRFDAEIFPQELAMLLELHRLQFCREQREHWVVKTTAQKFKRTVFDSAAQLAKHKRARHLGSHFNCRAIHKERELHLTRIEHHADALQQILYNGFKLCIRRRWRQLQHKR